MEGVMHFTEGLYTRKVAAKVGSMLKYLFEHPEDERFFEVKLVRYVVDSPPEEQTIFVRLLETPNPEDRVFPLADGKEVVRCVTNDGRRVDFAFGSALKERDLEPVLVLLEAKEM